MTSVTPPLRAILTRNRGGVGHVCESVPPNISSLEQVEAAWEKLGIDCFLSEKGDFITVSKLVVPKDERGKGIGTKAMKLLFAYADKTGKKIALTPSSDFGGSKRRLNGFYRGFGFRTYSGYAVREKLVRDPLGESRQKSVGSILYSELPDDLQQLILDFAFHDEGCEAASKLANGEDVRFPLYLIPTNLFPKHAVEGGHRDESYAHEIPITEKLPVVLIGNFFVDGRHRVFKASQTKTREVYAINLNDIGVFEVANHMGALKKPLFERVIRKDSHGRNVVWEQGDFWITVDDPEDPMFLQTHVQEQGEDPKVIGQLTLIPGRELDTRGYAVVGDVQVNKKYQGYRLGQELYRQALINLGPGYKGIASEGHSVISKKVPKIWKRLGARSDSGNFYLDRLKESSGKPKFWAECRKLCDTLPDGTKLIKMAVRNATKLSQDDFMSQVDVMSYPGFRGYDDPESAINDLIADDASSGFYRSKLGKHEVWFVQHHGFETFFT